MPFIFPLIYAQPVWTLKTLCQCPTHQAYQAHLACTWNCINYTFTHLPAGYGYSPVIDAKVALAVLAEISPTPDVSHHHYLLTFLQHIDGNLTHENIPNFSPQRTPETFYLPGKCQDPAQNVTCWSNF